MIVDDVLVARCGELTDEAWAVIAPCDVIGGHRKILPRPVADAGSTRDHCVYTEVHPSMGNNVATPYCCWSSPYWRRA
ncbi:hypothetical protein [Micromonospora sp. NPDC049102]|uniref:hypothetical protein n=1 Tax=Micromonospora sp. NPDC049102 TaxID=3364265 RepID=UPI0037247945